MAADYDAFRVTLGSHLLSATTHRFPAAWKWLGNLETASVAAELASIPIERPVYVAGLARSGSTLLLEFLARHPQVATHRYSDFPIGMFLPRLWNQCHVRRDVAPRERAHGDRMQVTPESPEAMEEVLWMAFFPDCHDPSRSQVQLELGANPAFEKFYVDHIRKLLLARGRSRYVAKGNYNVARLPYLQRIFSDARFVIPVRHPITHIASLMRQHRRFCEGQRHHRAAVAHLRRVGHFEFGLDRRPIHLEDPQTVKQVQMLWESGEEVRGWGRYWSYVYGWLHNRLSADSDLAAATQVVRYEDLCGEPISALTDVLRHCDLVDDTLASEFSSTVSAPDYYQPDFSDRDLAILHEETSCVAQRYGYADEGVSSDYPTLVAAR
jgi:hypothetical protein